MKPETKKRKHSHLATKRRASSLAGVCLCLAVVVVVAVIAAATTVVKSSDSPASSAASNVSAPSSQQQASKRTTFAKLDANARQPTSAARNRPGSGNVVAGRAGQASHFLRGSNSNNNNNQAEDMGALETARANQAAAYQQVSITPRVSLIRLPVESNAILKCLISSSQPTSKFAKKFNVHWSRFVHGENLYEQLEPATSGAQRQSSARSALAQSQTQSQGGSLSRKVHGSGLQNGTTTVAAANQAAASSQRQLLIADFLARSRQETNAISDLLVEATLSISRVRPEDNATYFCTATDGLDEQSQARIDLIALHRPIVELERILPARDSKSAQVFWQIISDGNTPIKRTILMVRNDSIIKQSSVSAFNPALAAPATGATEEAEQAPPFSSIVLDDEHHQWQRVDIPNEGHDELPDNFPAGPPRTTTGGAGPEPEASLEDSSVVSAAADVDVTSLGSPLAPLADPRAARRKQPGAGGKRIRSHNLTALLPGVTYNFRLAAVNDMGQSNWTHMAATMPNEIPAQISEIFLLSRSNDSLAIGWRRPAYDNAKTLKYEMQLFDLNRTMTLDANTSTMAGSHRTNFMYIFVNLNPGTDYHFHVRACSRAGCSAYSSPKLLTSTMDGESDEPLEVELQCHLDSGNVSISWLPPVNPRGQLLNYSVSLHSRADYRNQSGSWTSDEWRTTMETSDNHTLSLDASGLLVPNTNYVARVCANNRSRHCGRQNPLTTRAQCSTPPDLPGEIPDGLRLSRQTVDTPTEDKQESLVLDVPFVSRRNGTLSCIQVILIELPKSFGAASSLSDFLPNEPSDIQLSSFQDVLNEREESDEPPAPAESPGAAPPVPGAKGKRDERAIAYLADEMEPAKQQAAAPFRGDAETRFQLGDGLQQDCKSLESLQSRRRPYDGPLKPQTYYTAFVKLILVRAAQRQQKRFAKETGELEVLSKFSGYTEPMKTGDNILQVSLSGSELGPGDFGAIKLANWFNLSSPASLKELGARLGQTAVSQASKFYKSASTYMVQNVKLDAVGRFIAQSSPAMQLLEMGVIIFVVSLFLLFVIYLATLPSSMRRRRERKKPKQAPGKAEPIGAGYLVQADQQQQPQQYQMQNGVIQPQQPMLIQQQLEMQGYQQVSNSQNAQAKLYGEPEIRECPIHSSPMAQQRAEPDDARHPAAGQVYAGQTQAAQYQSRTAIYTAGPQEPTAYAGPMQRDHAHNQQPLFEYQNGAHAHYERNCRTLRRVNNDSQQQQQGHAPQAIMSQQALMDGQQQQQQLQHQHHHMTLSHGQTSVMSLAKRINKSIPLRLFNQVLEFRLRNGWLREEYESLPRLGEIAGELGAAPRFASQVKLRPQLIVSRNDTVSALISGNDHYEAGLVKLGNANLGAGSERRIICAKSPLDANSVWDFWRLVYEQEVSTIVMLTQNEDPASGELRCAHYWPTHDNEETTILSPRNDLVLSSDILPAKFKIRLETLEEESSADNYTVRRLTLLVMATRASENVRTPDVERREDETEAEAKADEGRPGPGVDEADDEELVIVERSVLQVQFYHWNTSSLANQMRIVKFIELAGEKHANYRPPAIIGDSPPTTSGANNSPLLVHCINGLGRSGLFAAMSFVLEDLAGKQSTAALQLKGEPAPEPKVNLFQLVSRLRQQRELLVSPYRFYELLYQLTGNCIQQRHHHHHHQQQQQQFAR